MFKFDSDNAFLKFIILPNFLAIVFFAIGLILW